MRDYKFKFVFRDRESGEISISEATTMQDIIYGGMAFIDENYVSIIDTLQYTGFFDVENQEIYQGDIVFDGTAKWVVEWIPQSACFELAKYHEESRVGIPMGIVENFSKIGNIYDSDKGEKK